MKTSLSLVLFVWACESSPAAFGTTSALDNGLEDEEMDNDDDEEEGDEGDHDKGKAEESVVFEWSENGHRYTLHRGPVAWHVARDACTSIGAYLVTYTSAAENAAVADAFAPEGAWIGFSSDVGWTWMTGEDPLFFAWAASEPTASTNLTAARQDANGYWHAEHVATALGFICEQEPWTVRAEDDHAYHVYYERVPFVTAQASCTLLDAHLVTINSFEEEGFLLALLHTTVWMGAQDPDGNGQYEWLTGEAMSLSNWSDTPAASECAVHTRTSWQTSDCTAAWPYLCEGATFP